MLYKNMKTILVQILILLNFHNAFGQKKATIIDSETREYIPYVNIWVENENIGTTSNEQGAFELNLEGAKNIVFSAIGFENMRIHSDSIKDFVELKPHPVQLNEVIVKSERKAQELVVGKFKKSKINTFFGCSSANPSIVARYFEYKEMYSRTPYVARIRFLTDSDVKDAKFNIRLYAANEKGEPKDYLYDKNIVVVAKKGKKITEVDLSELNIIFPKNGFFLAFEWLIIEENKFEYKYTMEGSRKKMHGISYEPSFGIEPHTVDTNNWIFIRGKWAKAGRYLRTVDDKYKNIHSIAVELTLRN